MTSSNDMIAETKLDIENRWFSSHRATCGLAKRYDRFLLFIDSPVIFSSLKRRISVLVTMHGEIQRNQRTFSMNYVELPI